MELEIREEMDVQCQLPNQDEAVTLTSLKLMGASAKAELTYRGGQATKPGSAQLFPAHSISSAALARAAATQPNRVIYLVYFFFI